MVRISRGCSQAKVFLIDSPENPYRDIVGLGWRDKSPQERFAEVLSKIKTGSDSLCKPKFVYKVEGLPRHQFAQHVRARIGVTFDYEDPKEKPDHYIFYTPVYDRMFCGWQVGSEEGGYFENPDFSVQVGWNDEGQLEYTPLNKVYTSTTKFGIKVTRQLLSIPEGSWKKLRDYLPLCFEQPYTFEIEYKALIGQCSRRLCLGEEAHIVANHYLQKSALYERFPLLASTLRAACLNVGSCLYARNYTLSNAFGCLFSGCNYRCPTGTEYSSFNQSCSDIRTLKEEIQPLGIVEKMDALEIPQSYEELDEKDKVYFE